MTTDDRIAALLDHGRGCPQAVKLGGPATVAAWCEQQELEIEGELADAEEKALAALAAAELAAEEAERVTAEAEARVASAIAKAKADGDPVEVTTPEEGPEDTAPEPGPFATTTPAIEAIHGRLTALESAVDALASEGPTEDAVGDVAAGGEPEAKAKKGGKKAGEK